MSKALADRKSDLDQRILAEYERRDVKEVIVGDTSYQRIQGERVTWDPESLRRFIAKKLGIKKAAKVVPTRTIIELDVDDMELAKLIDKKKIKVKQLHQFQDVQKLKPYIRAFAVKK